MNKLKKILYPSFWSKELNINEFNLPNYNTKCRCYVINKSKYKVKKVDGILILKKITSLQYQEPTLYIKILETNNKKILNITFKSSLYTRIWMIFIYIVSFLMLILCLIFKDILLGGFGCVFAIFSISLFNFMHYNFTLEILSDLKTLCK